MSLRPCWQGGTKIKIRDNVTTHALRLQYHFLTLSLYHDVLSSLDHTFKPDGPAYNVFMFTLFTVLLDLVLVL